MNDKLLKLTKSEYIELIKMWEDSAYIHTDYSLIKIVKENELVEIQDINKFKKFLKSITSINWTNCQELINYNMANTILTKLAKEVV
tara:strand:+ start:288 stop:548 length:261 start_codon:yes stop_codon:yes gene_type:complete